MTLKEFRDYFVNGDFHLALIKSGDGSWYWLFYLSYYSRTKYIKNISILKLYSDSTSTLVPYVPENIIISHVLFFRTMEMVNVRVDEWLKVRLISQEIPWGLSQRLIEYYQDLNRVSLSYSPNLSKDIIRLWRDTLFISRRKLLVVSDSEIDILEDFRDIAVEMLMELMLEEDNSVRGISICEPDYSFL